MVTHSSPFYTIFAKSEYLRKANVDQLSSRHTKDEMQRELLENMYRSNEFEDLLKESDFTIRRRKECQQMVESLTRASEIVSQVQ